MRRPLLLAATALLCLPAAPGRAFAYTQSATGTTTPVYLRWFSSPTYYINAQTGPALPNIDDASDPLTAVRRGFEAWADAHVSALSVSYGGTTAITTASGSNPVNVVSFVDSTFAYNGALAVTQFWYNGSGQISHADMVFNPTLQWSTVTASDSSSSTAIYDIQSVTTHEAGHFYGLNHSGDLAATMYPYSDKQRQVERFLDTDDLAAIAQVYPLARFSAATGGIAGTVTKGGAPVYGAQVVAVDASGHPYATALTLKDGTYTLRGLAPGTFTVYAEPLDGPMTQGNLNGFWGSGNGAFDTAFATTWRGGNGAPTSVTVVAGGTSSGIDIAVPNGTPAANITYIGKFPAGTGSLSANGLPVLLPQGAGPAWNIVLGGTGLTAGSTFQVLGAGVTQATGFGYGTFGNGTPFVYATFNVTSNAPATPRTVRADSGGQVAMLTGGVDLVPTPATLFVRRDGIVPGGVYLSWYAMPQTFTLKRATKRDFSNAVTLANPKELQFSDPVFNDGQIYYYKLDQ